MDLFNLLNELETATVEVTKVEAFNVLSTPTVKIERKAKKESNVPQELIFDEDTETSTDDVRTERQRNRKVSYDVGEVIGGGRKEYRTLKERFIASPTADTLEEIADLDEVAANELATKKNVFSWFSMDNMAAKEVEVNAAYGMSLLIRRLPTNANGLNRNEYMIALNFISDNLKVVRTVKEFEQTLYRFQPYVASEKTIDYLKELEARKKSVLEDELDKDNDQRYILSLTAEIRMLTGRINVSEYNKDLHLDKLDKFADLLRSHTKYKNFVKSYQKYHSWEDYYEQQNEKKGEKKEGTKRKPVWERKLPETILREGGREVPKFRKPEEYREYFGFRAIECGHWMKDEDALVHLINSGRAFVDLADLLELDIKHISLGNELAIAFGARGRSRAAGHYERGYNVINFTKVNGSLGVASHEWFHAFDRYIKKKLAITDEMELMTEGNNIHEYPLDVQEALTNLLASFREGQSVEEFEIDPFASYRISAKSRELFEECNYNVRSFVDTRLAEVDKMIERNLAGYLNESSREKAAKKYATRRKKELRAISEVAAILHREKTGEQLYHVPYTVNESRFYSNARKLDRNKKDGYWASNIELAARAFEAYINLKLKRENRVSHYLVCGLDSYAYPYGSELERISKAMDKFLKVTLPYLREEATTI